MRGALSRRLASAAPNLLAEALFALAAWGSPRVVEVEVSEPDGRLCLALLYRTPAEGEPDLRQFAQDVASMGGALSSDPVPGGRAVTVTF